MLDFQLQELSDLQWMASNAVYHVQRLREGEVPGEKLHTQTVINTSFRLVPSISNQSIVTVC